jgi:hypothetical protein
MMTYHVSMSSDYTNGSGGMTTEAERIDALGREFTNSHDGLLVKSLDRKRTFAEAVDDYRRLQAEFVARAANSEFAVLETSRRVAETILSLAREKHPPFEVCREAWNEIVRLGFTGIDERCTSTWSYVDCCAYDEQPEEGLAVLEPLLGELERQREERRATQQSTGFQDYYIERLADLRDELLAQQRGQLDPERSTRRVDEAHQPTAEEERIDELYDELSKACSAVFKTFARTRERSFADVAADYKRIEADLTARAGESEAFQEFALDVRGRIAGDILRAATRLEQPFEVCQEAWNEVVRLGFEDLGEQCRMASMYARACVNNHRPEEGLAIIEPLLAELERGLDAELERRREARAKGEIPTKAEWPPWAYRATLRSLAELRDKLEAQRRGGAASL